MNVVAEIKRKKKKYSSMYYYEPLSGLGPPIEFRSPIINRLLFYVTTCRVCVLCARALDQTQTLSIFFFQFYVDFFFFFSVVRFGLCAWTLKSWAWASIWFGLSCDCRIAFTDRYHHHHHHMKQTCRAFFVLFCQWPRRIKLICSDNIIYRRTHYIQCLVFNLEMKSNWGISLNE